MKCLLYAKLFVGGRPEVISDHFKRMYVWMVIIGGFSTTIEACKLVKQEFANEISVLIVWWALNLAILDVCVKKKKPLLSQKNIQACIDFAKSHKNLTIVDWKQVLF